MRHYREHIVSNPNLKGIPRLLGKIIRRAPLTRHIEKLSIDEPMMKIASGCNKTEIPLSLVQRLVKNAPSTAFGRSYGNVRLSGYDLINMLEEIEGEKLPLRMRYAVIDALCVAWAATVFTFGGDVTLEADEGTIALAKERAAMDGFKHGDTRLALAHFAAKVSRRPLTMAA